MLTIVEGGVLIVLMALTYGDLSLSGSKAVQKLLLMCRMKRMSLNIVWKAINFLFYLIF